jgi:thiol-disulfide isomerase/thioredoxin
MKLLWPGCAVSCWLLSSAIVVAAWAEEKPSAEKPRAAEPASKPDPFAVPDGTPEELLKHIEGLRNLRPEPPVNRQKWMDHFGKVNTAMLSAAEKILAARPTDAQYEAAIEIKIGALSALTMLDARDAPGKLAALAADLKKAGKLQLARLAQRAVFEAKAGSIFGAKPEAIRELYAEIKKFLAESPAEPADLAVAAMIPRALEAAGDTKAAAEVYRDLAKLAADGKGKAAILKKFAASFEGGARRMDLPGRPVKIEGLTLDGKPFEWEKFQKGKVVLIDFWATWCGWCIREFPEMEKLYKAYRDRGFEIVGLSGDQTREPLDEFLKANALPWTIVYGKDGPSPTIQYYGISAFPTQILVDNEGNVISLNARGKKLRAELKRLLGPMKEKEADEEGPDGEKGQGKQTKKKGKKAQDGETK